jgi:hypothetical protein
MSYLTFNRKAMPIIAEYRPMFKIAQILLILFYSSRGKKSSLIRLHLINWALKDSNRKAALIESSVRKEILFDVWGIDPALNLSLQFGVAEGLIERKSSTYKITTKASEFIQKIGEDSFYYNDIVFLKGLGTTITENMVNEIVGAWE